MKIKELITVLQSAPDKEAAIWIEGKKRDFIKDIGYSFDDNNDIQLYEIAEQKGDA